MHKANFYFDFTSPYSYLMFEKFVQDGDYWFSQVKLKFSPIMVGRVFSLIGSTGPGEVKAKREYLFKDALRKANQFDIILRSPASMPFNPLPMLRMVDSLAREREKQISFITHTFRYGWKYGYDYENFEEYRKFIIENCHISEAEFFELEQNKESRRNLKATINQAVEDGIFGVPSILVDEELFWGLDTLEEIKKFLESKKTDYSQVEFNRFKNILIGEKHE